MRLTLWIEAQKTVSQKILLPKINVAIQCWIYGLLENTHYDSLHDSTCIKYFCFSNVFGPINITGNYCEGKRYGLSIVSPIQTLIQLLRHKITPGTKITWGEFLGVVKKVEVSHLALHTKDCIRSVTPIIVTVHRNNKAYALDYAKEEKNYMKYLAINLIRKTNRLHGLSHPDDYPLWQDIDVTPLRKATLVIPVESGKGKWFDLGCMLRFSWKNIRSEKLRILQCGFDSGFGVKNGYGRGFMIRERER